MAAPGKPAASGGSKWGSFLSQAVAGVESRLDNMLAEAADPGSQWAQQQQQQQRQQVAATAKAPAPTAVNNGTLQPVKPSPGNSRSSSSNRVNDRLQARLAKAVARKNGSPRESLDQAREEDVKAETAETTGTTDTTDDMTDKTEEKVPGKDTAENDVKEVAKTDTAETVKTDTAETVKTDAAETVKTDTTEIAKADTTETAKETVEPTINETAQDATETKHMPATVTIPSEDIVDLAKELEQIKLRQQDEVNEYVERIDSLESKLQYLSKSAAESAKSQAAAAPSGSTERKIAEKDEKIALLMEEGQKLATGEQKYRTIIKKLRQQIADNEKQSEELRKNKDKALADAETLRTQLNSSAEKEKRQEEAKKATASLQKEIDTLKKDKTSRDETIRKLEKDLKTKTELADKVDGLNKNLNAEKEKNKMLEDMNASLLAEKETLGDKAKQDGIEWSEKVDRAVERGRAVEAELRTELQAMEAKLEAMRTQAEEVTSGSGGEAQVKLLRQIETLQSQYATASNNWQGIEATLLSKVSNLEKERDEAQRRESEMRKKARDATTRARNFEEELEDIQPALARAQRDLDKAHKEVASLRSAAKSAESALDEARADLEKERRSASRENTTRESEQREWADDFPGSSIKNGPSRPDSPMLSVPRTFSSDMMGISLPLPGRRLSGQPPFAKLNAGGSHSGSGPAPPSPFSPFEGSSESPILSPPALERENGLDEIVSPSSPRQGAQDMISMSTVAAGPSVQLVERMSAAIRRLEAEKVAAKEEMARVCSQRDEARGDMVSLMKDLEEAKTATARVPDLEKEVAELDQRYQTTLEMLGEKSELVEELKADVQDVKAMYRELVERTVK